MATYSRARQKLIPPGANDPRIKVRMGILHVDAGNVYDLHPYFDGRSGGIESHFHIPKERVNGINLFQYRDTAYEADANYKANSFAMSVESQGYGEGIWSDHQMREIKFLMNWGNQVHEIPYRVVTSWNDPEGGWGYHTLFGSPSYWTPRIKSCPGDERKEQFHDVLAPWMREKDGGMGFTASDRGVLLGISNRLEAVEKLAKHQRWVEKARYRKVREILATRFKYTDAQIREVLGELEDEE